MNQRALALWGVGALAPVSFAWSFYDHSVGSGFSYSAANGACDGGIYDYGANFGLQEGQLVTAVAGGTMIPYVRADFLQFSDFDDEVWIDVYDAAGHSLIGSTGAVPATKTYFTDSVFGLMGVSYTARAMIGGLQAGNSYLVCMQVVGPSWAFICRDVNGLDESFARDYSHYGYPGGYGCNSWESFAGLGFGAGQTCMAILTPEPCELMALGAGALATAWARRRAQRSRKTQSPGGGR